MAVEIPEAQIIAEMTPEQKQFYMSFYGNKSQLKSEWELCDKMYNKAMSLYQSKDASKQYVRSPLRKIADYWSHRRNAMETMVTAIDLEEWKKQ